MVAQGHIMHMCLKSTGICETLHYDQQLLQEMTSVNIHISSTLRILAARLHGEVNCELDLVMRITSDCLVGPTSRFRSQSVALQ